MDCLFCKIIEGTIPSRKAYEDDMCLAFYDIAPQTPIHIVVIPKMHINTTDEMTPANMMVLGHMMEKIPCIARLGGIFHGYRVVTNVGDDAGQTISHLHLHILGGKRLSEMMG